MKLNKSLVVFVLPLIAFILPSTGSAQVVVQSSNMIDFVTGEEVAGAAILTRSPGRRNRSSGQVDVSMHLTGLQPRGAYTAWWIVFNEPDDCTDPCGDDDLFSGVGQGFYATGYVATPSGVANAYATLREGPVPEGADKLSTFFAEFFPDGYEETGLLDASTAEIHLITARNHGPITAGQAAEQLGSFDGACGPDFALCADEQAVVFPAP